MPQATAEGAMLQSKNAEATIAVRDLSAARKFYEGALGLEPIHEEGSEAITYRTGSSELLVYRSQFAGTNRATAATWTVGNEIEGIVRDLRAKNVPFEHYDLPGSRLKGDVHEMGDTKAAWFKDPDGNILALVGR